jgi:hypothetical protein
MTAHATGDGGLRVGVLAMMFGLLPPSSWHTRLTVWAAFFATSMPAGVEPVKDTMSTPGCELIAAPTVGPSPLTRLKTPGETPAASRISAKIRPEKGAISEGLMTIVQPVASARDLAGDR